MKRRRVIVTLEIETDWTLWALSQPHSWGLARGRVLQAQANRVGKSIGNPVFPRRKKKPARRA